MSAPPPPRRGLGLRSKTWAMDLIRRHTPTREEMAANKYLAPIAHRFLSPELWRFTRRSVPRGVALGLFAAFIIPVGQIFLAAFLALPARANVPLSALATFITNPFTLPFWLVVANKVGNFTLRLDAAGPQLAQATAESGLWSSALAFVEMAGATAFGFAVLAVVAPSIGYLVASWVWRVVVARKRAKRLKIMEARLDQRLGAQ
ncbi:MAG: hypothetical protein KatS3mg120_2066 [Erythrobacter sp.]|nr:MAG: hypothetical protein KatS3mg120_2066 [Erythrobacter sp.]